MFNDCIVKRKLKFDFYLPKKNLIIEFDGEQHFKPMDYFGGEKLFKMQQKYDIIKNDYAKTNKIQLIRIPYNRLNDIQNILNNLIE